jgi:dolichol-phosphate mannosyltransferase
MSGVISLNLDISVIIPTYNEKGNISRLIEGLNSSLSALNLSYEIIIVDDNSPDGTAKVVENISEEHQEVVLFSRDKKSGVGSAVVDGVMSSKGEVVITMDADLSHPIELVHSLIKPVGEVDIVIASRFIKGGRMEGPLHRVLLSKILNFLIRSILNLDILDCTGGFMAVKRQVFDHVGNLTGRYGDYAFELIYKAKKFKRLEVPFVYKWRSEGDSKTSIVKYGYVYIRSALSLAFNSINI